VIEETGWRWDEVRTTTFTRLWMLFGYWARRAGGVKARIPPPPSQAEIAAALSRVAWRN
jgi:hypothetical protein